MELLKTGISTAPWKRIAESLRPDESLIKAKNGQGLYVYRVRTMSAQKDRAC